MTVFDLIVIFILVLSTGLAAMRGALLELATLLALGIAGLLSFQFAGSILEMTGKEGSVMAMIITHFVLIGIFFIVFYVITHLLLMKFPLSTRGIQINRIVGGLFGFLRGYVVIGLGFLAYGYYLDEEHQHESVRDALTTPFAASGAAMFERFIPDSTQLKQNGKDDAVNDADVATQGYGRSDRAGLSEVPNITSLYKVEYIAAFPFR